MKLSANAPCPCHSGKKYKLCCQSYHRGILPATALLLMRSRYSAYALGLADYIIKTTHPDNPDFTSDTMEWKNGILEFCRSSRFTGLKITEFIDGESEAFVTFEAVLDHGSINEKSRFLKVAGRWLYESGTFF
ncbi:MAG: SEC-C domain-containing protein [Campylobacterales bacterium]|nr:SEC-C domain-containing protein [Campylobacterales bacterium]